jgi:microcystin degradation protein MlrC
VPTFCQLQQFINITNMSIKILIARLNHETNTFSPVATPIEAFGVHGPLQGQNAYRDQKGARTAMGVFLDIAEAIPGATVVTPLSATANPSGTVEADAYSRMCDMILAEVAQGCDAVMLDLHGAMVAENAEDGEGLLLEKIRRAAPDTPICVALDLHGNVTQKMMDNCDIIVSFKTYPHIDMAETGAHAGRILLDMLLGRATPVMRWRQLPLLSHTLNSNTSAGAMQRAVEAAKAAETESGVLAVSVLAGFSLADFPDAGMSVVVVTDGDADLADAVADRIARQIWNDRAGFVYASEPLSHSLRRAQELARGPGHGPVLLLDHSDNVMSGGTCDTMDVLAAAIQAGLTDIAVGPLCDPEAVARLAEAGVGARVTTALGNRTALVQQGISKQPVMLSGVVRAVTQGEFVVTGPIYTGSTVHMGRTVLFDTGSAQIVVTEQRVEPYDLGVLTSVGIDPSQKTFLLLKSRMYCRPVFLPLSKGLVECDSDAGGPTSSNYALFPFQRIRRPIYPLDQHTTERQA